jgi:hypothetical protein
MKEERWRMEDEGWLVPRLRLGTHRSGRLRRDVAAAGGARPGREHASEPAEPERQETG